MTTPDERRRNLLWGREMLKQFSVDTGLTSDWRAAAGVLLASYPSLDFLRHFDATEPSELDPYAGVLFQVRMLFSRVLASSCCSEQRAYSLRVVLRHFP